MLKSWGLTNFKSISNADLELKPLTIICGPNSSGKSSFLQSILLLAQTMQHQNSKENHPLHLNGDFTKLGSFEDVVTNNNNEFKIRFKYEPTQNNYVFNNSYPLESFGYNDKAKIIGASVLLTFINNKNDKDHPELFNTELLIELQSINNNDENSDKDQIDYTLTYIIEGSKVKSKKVKYRNDEEKDIVACEEIFEPNHFLFNNITINGKHAVVSWLLNQILKGLSIHSENDKYDFPKHFPDRLISEENVSPNDFASDNKYTKNITYNIFEYLIKELFSNIKEIDSYFDWNFLQEHQSYPVKDFIESINKLDELELFKIKKIIKDNFNNIYNKMYDELSKTCEESDELFDEDYIASNNLGSLLKEIISLFKNIIYFGPLREDPKSIYPKPEEDIPNISRKKGGNTAEILAKYGENKRKFPIPNDNNPGECKTDNIKLIDAVRQWLKHIGVADDIKAESLDYGYTLKIITPGSKIFCNLTNVGVGASQVIPIIVNCLNEEKDSTFINEHPELNLHPKMQSKLADFFIAISQSGKQCIIETHSEHIINRLRNQVAKAKSPYDEKLANGIQIYFTEKDEKGTFFRSINMDKYADIPEWPEGFFDEAEITNINTLIAINEKLEREKKID
jgi:predicted ATPase